MKKFLIATALVIFAVLTIPKTVKADGAYDQAVNFAKVQEDWAKQQADYYRMYEVPVMNMYNIALTNQYSQALAAQYQSDVMALQSQARAAANSYQLWANEYAHQQNIATQYANMKNTATYNAVNLWDQSFYNNQEMVLKTYGMMFGQYPFPQYQ